MHRHTGKDLTKFVFFSNLPTELRLRIVRTRIVIPILKVFMSPETVFRKHSLHILIVLVDLC